MAKFKRNINIIIFALYSFAFFASYSTQAQPIPITTDSRIRTLVYNPDEVYELKFYYGYQSFIEFADNEEIEMISIGESFAWKLSPSGKRLFIRPLEISSHTNMTLITNKRTYYFDIKSGEYNGKADEELVYTVRFFYPQINQPLPIKPQLLTPNTQNPRPLPIVASNSSLPTEAPLKNEQTSVMQTPIPELRIDKEPHIIASRQSDNLNFNYSVAGRSDKIIPSRVYDNGKETFFQFPNNNKLVPKISKVMEDSSEIPLKYIIKDNFVIIEGIARQYTLRTESELICILNNKLLTIK